MNIKCGYLDTTYKATDDSFEIKYSDNYKKGVDFGTIAKNSDGNYDFFPLFPIASGWSGELYENLEQMLGKINNFDYIC